MAREDRQIRYTLRAAKTVHEHALYHEGRASGLGQRFMASLRDAERLAQSNPEGFQQIAGPPGIRVVVVRRFPFRLLYALRDNAILIVAVAHTARKPSRFFSR